jgi:biotin carboxyl carrier protein
MENEIYAASEGVVKEVYVELGQQVSHGDKLVLIS